MPFDKTIVYYKITNFKEIHHKYQYHDGLNVLTQRFNNKRYESCVKGGLYFTTKEHLHEYAHYGIWIREVRLPQNDPELQVVMDPAGDKWRANKIILGKKYSVFDSSAYVEIGLDINKFNYFCAAAKYGIDYYVEAYLRAGKVNRADYYTAISHACQKGKICVLELLKKYAPYKFLCDELYVQFACINSHVKIMEWAKENSIVFTVKNNEIDHNNHELVMWFVNNPQYIEIE